MACLRHLTILICLCKQLHLLENQNQMKPVFATAFLVVMLSFSTTYLFGQNYFACGPQTGTWQYDTVFVDCDVQVPAGALLQIMPGTKVIFRGYYSLQVQGSLKALGTAADSIVFTVADTTGFGNIHSTTGGWNGLRFEFKPIASDSSLFSHCIFRYGKAAGDSSNCYGGAARALQTDKIAFRHCSFVSNYAFYWGGAIYGYKTNVLVEHCRFVRNHAGNDGMVYGYGGALSYVSAEPDIRHCYFAYNSSTGIGGAASFEYSRPLLMNSVFEHNFSALGGAVGFLRSVPNRPIANLLVRNNEAVFFGGGIASITASPEMTNLTIVNNHAPMGGGYYCNYEAHAKLYNSILWGNTCYGDFGSQVWIWDVNSMPEFHHSVVQFGVQGFGGSTFIGVYNNCIESDPQFVDATGNNFRLQASSAAINTGTATLPSYILPETDLDDLPRNVNGSPDMGAFEYQGLVGLPTIAAPHLDLRVFPNPGGTAMRIILPEGVEGVIQLNIFLSDGRLLASFNNPAVRNGQIFIGELLQRRGIRIGEFILQTINFDRSQSVARVFYQPSNR